MIASTGKKLPVVIASVKAPPSVLSPMAWIADSRFATSIWYSQSCRSSSRWARSPIDCFSMLWCLTNLGSQVQDVLHAEDDGETGDQPRKPEPSRVRESAGPTHTREQDQSAQRTADCLDDLGPPVGRTRWRTQPPLMDKQTRSVAGLLGSIQWRAAETDFMLDNCRLRQLTTH